MSEHNSYEKHILKCALSVIAKHSISGTRMRLIADEAGMTASNLVYHFKTKRDLLLALLHDIQEDYEEERYRYLVNSDDTLPGKLNAFFEQKKASILYTPEKERVQFDFWVLGQSDLEIGEIFQHSYTLWHDHIAAIIQEYCPGISLLDSDLIAYHMIALMMGGSMQYLNQEQFDLNTYFERGLTMFLNQINSINSDLNSKIK